MSPRQHANPRWRTVALGCLATAAGLFPTRAGRAVEPPLHAEATATQSLHTLDIRGRFFGIVQDSLWSTGGGQVTATLVGDSLVRTRFDSAGFRLHLRVPAGRVELAFAQIGFDPQVRTIRVDGDMDLTLAPVCTEMAYGPPPTPIPLPARALLDEARKPICDYPPSESLKPYDWKLKRKRQGMPDQGGET